jgi:hypothetical protein
MTARIDGAARALLAFWAKGMVRAGATRLRG